MYLYTCSPLDLGLLALDTWGFPLFPRMREHFASLQFHMENGYKNEHKIYSTKL